MTDTIPTHPVQTAPAAAPMRGDRVTYPDGSVQVFKSAEEAAKFWQYAAGLPQTGLPKDAYGRFLAWATPFLWATDKAALDLAWLAWRNALSTEAAPAEPAEAPETLTDAQIDKIAEANGCGRYGYSEQVVCFDTDVRATVRAALATPPTALQEGAKVPDRG